MTIVRSTSRRTLSMMASIAAAAALLPAGAMAGSAPTAVQSVDITGAYASVITLPSHQKAVRVVFRTADALPRRSSGGLRAGAGLDDQPPGSISSVRAKRDEHANCYAFIADDVKDGKLVGSGKSASVGSRHKVTVVARGTDGDVHDSLTVKMTDARGAASARKRLGC